MIYLKVFLVIISASFIAACSGVVLSPAEFGWPIESVIKVDSNGFVKEDRHSLSFNTKPMFLKETEDSTAFNGKSIHLIRNNEGFYFITAAGFKNVYVFNMSKGALAQQKIIQISETAVLKNPAFNQRTPFVELIDEGNKFNLTSDGIDGGEE
jgi:hypothetical protein